jgi:aminoglycoside 6'-N-acetyltransferase
MRLALDRCFFSYDVTAVIIDPLESNLRAKRFYQRLGFHLIGDRTFALDQRGL